MKHLISVAISLTLGLFAAFAVAGDLDAVVENCNGCHGNDGVSQWTDVPTIAGIPEFVHSDDEVAAYYPGQPFVAAKQDFDAALAEAGKALHAAECDRCHSEGGANPEDEASILAGQQMGYLMDTFAEYRSGEREQPQKMEEKVSALSDDDVKALVHYYASQRWTRRLFSVS